MSENDRGETRQEKSPAGERASESSQAGHAERDSLKNKGLSADSAEAAWHKDLSFLWGKSFSEAAGDRRRDSSVKVSDGGLYFDALKGPGMDRSAEKQTENWSAEKKGDLSGEKAHLQELAGRHFESSQRETFLTNMATFEQRASQLEDMYKKEGLSPQEAEKKAKQEVADTYHEISRILEVDGRAPLDEHNRRVVARQVMDHAADPYGITQGEYNTCNVTTVETRTYTRSPSAAARLVADVATTGEYVAGDGVAGKSGTKVRKEVLARSIKPHGEATNEDPPDGERGLASQIFQVTAVNVHYAKVDPSGRRHYEQLDPGKKPDNGERLFNGKNEVRGSDGKPMREPNLDDHHIVEVSNAITGRQEQHVMLEYHKFVTGDASKIDTITSEQELNDRLSYLSANGKLPVIIGVDTNAEPFYTDSGRGAAGGSGGEHVVTVTDYQAGPPAKVSIQNQWDSESHHVDTEVVSVHDLFTAMRDSADKETIKDMESWHRQNNPNDLSEEMNILRHRHHAWNKAAKEGHAHVPPQLSESEYLKAQTEAIKQAGNRWGEQKQAGKLDQVEYENGQEVIQKTISAMPADRQLTVLKMQRDNGHLDRESYAQKMAETFERVYKKWQEHTDEAANRKLPRADLAEQKRFLQKFAEVTKALPGEERDKLAQSILEAKKLVDSRQGDKKVASN
jgi:hypothetical protein